MPVRIIVNGALGKMGKLACVAIGETPGFELVAQLSRNDDLRHAISVKKADIVVDLTRADSVYANTLNIIESGAHPVIGTSGLSDNQIDDLRRLCESKQLGGIIAPNFSISAVLMMRFSALAARYLGEVEIIEAHHPQKYDAPSGTAIKTAEMIASARLQAPPESMCNESLPGVRGGLHQGVPIHSLRLSGVIAKQQVIYGSVGETLTISHESIDRVSFMPGIILCCKKVQALNTLYYGLEALLE